MSRQASNKKLFFTQYDTKLSDFDNYISDEFIKITLHPSVQAELTRKGIAFSNSIPYYGMQGHKTVLTKSKEIIELLRPVFDVSDTNGVRHAYNTTFFFKFRFYLNYWLMHLYVIHTAKCIYDPDEFIIPPVTDGSRLAQTGCFDYMLGDVAYAYATAHDISVTELSDVNKNTIPSRSKKKIPGWFKKLTFELLLLGYKFTGKKRSIVLTPSDTYNMPRLLYELKQEIPDIYPVYITSRMVTLGDRFKETLKGQAWMFGVLPVSAAKQTRVFFKKNLNSSLNNIRKIINKNTEAFNFFGVDLSDHLTNYIENVLVNDLLQLNANVSALSRIISIHKPKAAFSQHSLGLGYALGEICSARKIPAMLISHGTHVPHIGEYAKLEWEEHAKTLVNTHYPYVSSQTPWAEKYLKSIDNLKSEIIITGPLLFARKSSYNYDRLQLRNKIYKEHSEKTIILHAGTPKPSHSIRPWVYETVDEYVSNINDLIIAVEKTQDFYLAVRFRSSSVITASELKYMLVDSNCYDIYEEGTFEEYLLSADLLVSYSSTTIEEALQNRLPVLQYDPQNKYCHIPAETITSDSNLAVSPIYYVKSSVDLEYALDWINKSHIKGKCPSNEQWSEHTYIENVGANWLSEMGLKA